MVKLAEIESLLGACDALADAPFNYAHYTNESNRISTWLDDMNNRAGDSVAVGKLLRFQVADGYAMYIITKVNAKSVKVEHVYLWDGYQAPYLVRNGSIPRAVAEEVIQRDNAWNKILAERQPA